MHFLFIRNNEGTIRVKHFSTKKKDGIFHNFYQIKVSRYRFKSGVAILAYAYSPFKDLTFKYLAANFLLRRFPSKARFLAIFFEFAKRKQILRKPADFAQHVESCCKILIGFTSHLVFTAGKCWLFSVRFLEKKNFYSSSCKSFSFVIDERIFDLRRHFIKSQI